MSAWEEAAARVERGEPQPMMPSGIVPPTPLAGLVVVDHFDPTMIDVPSTGCILRVRSLTKYDAAELIRSMPSPPPIVLFERAALDIERDLNIPPGPRARVTIGTSLLVRTRITWNDVRWHLISYEADG